MNILDTIVEQKRVEVALLPKETVTVDLLRAAVQRRGGIRDFAASFCGDLSREK